MATTTYQLPFPNPDRADGFGSTSYLDGGKRVKRAHPHRGVDFPQAAGTPIRAIADGTIALVEQTAELGWTVVVRHERTSSERLQGLKPVFSGYCHMSTNPGLAKGHAVQRGAELGRVGVQGKNGTQAAGEHLHLTMSHAVRGYYEGEVFDPLPFIEARVAKPSAATVKPAAARVKTHTVVKGEMLSTIAEANGTTWQHLAALNGLRNPDLIVPGQVLRIT